MAKSQMPVRSRCVNAIRSYPRLYLQFVFSGVTINNLQSREAPLSC
jgi:hypothetical protein